MDTWQSWATVILGFLLSVLGFSIRADKQRTQKHIDENVKLVERVTRIESTLVTDKDVREVLKEYLDPILKMQDDITEIKVQLGKIPKRKGD